MLSKERHQTATGPISQLNAAIDGLYVPLHTASKGTRPPFNEPLNIPSNAVDHLRQHRPGRPSRIDGDPQLRAFIVKRIYTTTFTALEKAVADHFPLERRVKKSALTAGGNETPNTSANPIRDGPYSPAVFQIKMYYSYIIGTTKQLSVKGSGLHETHSEQSKREMNKQHHSPRANRWHHHQDHKILLKHS